MPISRKALRIYAALDSLKQDPTDDVLDALIPFMLPILSVWAGKIFSPRLIVVGVRALYGWNITEEVAEEFGIRLREKGLIKRAGDQSEPVYVVQEIESAPDDHNEQKISEIFDALTEEFRIFTEQLSDLLHYNKQKHELEEILLAFIVSLDLFDESGVVERITGGKGVEEEFYDSVDEADVQMSKEDRYLCARFIQYLYKERVELLEYISRIAAAGLLKSVVEDFRKPRSVVQQSDSIIALDAPVAMNYLGISGAIQRNNIRNILDSLKALGCRLVVFPVSCDEISRNIRALLNLQRHQRFGPTHAALLAGEVEESYLRTAMNRPERALQAVGVEVRQATFEDMPNTHKFFPEEHYKEFYSRITWIADSPDARDHDAQCMAIVMRLSRGEKKSDPLDCPFLFVTSNMTFARNARRYAIQNRMIDQRHVSPVVHQRDLATVAWLRTGFEASESIPTSQLLSHCERILSVRKDFLKKAGEIVLKLNEENVEQYELMLQDSRAVRCMLDETHGDEKFITEDNADELLAAMRRATAREIEEKYKKIHDEQRATHREERRRLRKEKEDAIKEKERAIEESGSRISEYEKKLSEMERIERRRHMNEIATINSCIQQANILSNKLNHVLTIMIIATAGIFAIDMLFGLFRIASMQTIPGAVLAVIMLYYLVMEILGKNKFGVQHVCHFVWTRKFKSLVRDRGVARSKYLSEVRPIAGKADFIEP